MAEPVVAASQLPACGATPNCVSSLAVDGSRYIAPLALGSDPEPVWQALQQQVLALPRTAVVAHEAGYLHVVVASRVFGFKDDLYLLLDSQQQRVQVCSAARSGYYDFGVNRRRVERLRASMARRNP